MVEAVFEVSRPDHAIKHTSELLILFVETEYILPSVTKMTNHAFLMSTACVRRLQANAYIRRFAAGKRKSRVKFKKDLAVVTEFEDRLEDALAHVDSECASPMAMMNTIVNDNLWAIEDALEVISPKAANLTSMLSLSSSVDSGTSRDTSILSDSSNMVGSILGTYSPSRERSPRAIEAKKDKKRTRKRSSRTHKHHVK